MIPRKHPLAIGAGEDLCRHPTPTAHFDGTNHMLAKDAPGAIIMSLGDVHPPSDLFRADDRHAEEPRPHHLRCPRKHPDRGHEPRVRPGGLVEEVLKVLAVNVAV
jgi:hypothetical protein